MAEMVLTLPFIFFLLLLILFFGWSVNRLQRASVQDRYEAWRMVYYGYGPSTTGRDPDDPDAYQGTEQINDAFWHGSTDALTYDVSGSFPNDTRDILLDETARASLDAGNLAQNALELRMPHGRHVVFHTTHDSRSPILDELSGPIRHGHTRIGNEWKFANAMQLDDQNEWEAAHPRVILGDAIRDEFLIDLDEPLEQIGGQSQAAGTIRWYYRGFPSYLGPDVDDQFE